MITSTAAPSRRERAILVAVSEGRCSIDEDAALLVDGRCCSHQFAAARLRSEGWIRPATPGDGAAPVELTDAGASALRARACVLGL